MVAVLLTERPRVRYWMRHASIAVAVQHPEVSAGAGFDFCFAAASQHFYRDVN